MHSPHPLRKTLQLSLHSAQHSDTPKGRWPHFLRQVQTACD